MRHARLSKMLVVASMSLAAAAAQAQYPQHRVTLYVSTAPSAGPDILARVLAEKLRERWGQTVVVENRPGAGHNIAGETLSRAAPDGYTLLLTPQGMLVTNKSLYSKLSYDPEALEPISVLIKAPMVLVVNPKLPVRTAAELIAYAKANPGRLTYGSAGTGTTPHLTAELFNLKANVRMTHVPYRSNSLAATDVLSGQIDLMFLDFSSVLPHIRSGRVLPIAVIGDKRSADLPDVPALGETLPGVSVTSWWGLIAPPKTPPEIIAKISADVAAILKTPDMAKRLAGMGNLEAIGSTPAEAASYITQERKVLGELIRTLDIKAE